MKKVQDLQMLAEKYGIDDIFQDNGGKVLQSLILLGLTASPGREGNDALDIDGNEYELKTINIKKRTGVTTHHHLNLKILAKYRKVKAWYISLYEGINLIEIYKIDAGGLEPLFKDWENILVEVSSINNPKIPLSFIYNALQTEHATRVYPIILEGISALERICDHPRKPRKTKKMIHSELTSPNSTQQSLWEEDAE